MFGKICFPIAYPDDPVTGQLYGYVNTYFDVEWIQENLADIEAAMYFIFGSIGLAFVLGFIWMFIMKKCAGPLVWLALFGTLFALIALTVFCYMKYSEKEDELNATPAGEEREINWYGYAVIGLGIITITFMLFLCCYFRKLKIVVRVMETAADFVTEIWSVMFVPPCMMILFLMWFAVGLYILLYIFAMGTIEQAPAGEND